MRINLKLDLSIYCDGPIGGQRKVKELLSSILDHEHIASFTSAVEFPEDVQDEMKLAASKFLDRNPKKYIACIKEIRTKYGLGLGEAKDVVDSIRFNGLS